MGKNPCNYSSIFGFVGGEFFSAGKEIGNLTSWKFDQKNIDEREFIYSQNITPRELIEDNVQRRIDAYFPPKAGKLATKIFNFFQDMQSYTVNAAGMEHFVICLDQEKIGNIGIRDYGIELSRYLPMFKRYERKMLESYKRDREARK